AHSDLPYVSISNTYRKLNYPEDLNYAATIYNGIDIDAHNLERVERADYLLFLGRVCPDKGTAEAIELAQELALPLKIAGKIDPADREYFNHSIKPHLSSKIEYIGEVNFSEKLKLYAGAIALLYPVKFEEPFGLVMAEALAGGVPIMALRRGSVSELVSDGETGILGDSVKELLARFGEVAAIKSQKCTERARSLFSKERMLKEYTKLYERIKNGNNN
ncbi:MAG: glycosyltransferase, partial [Candidatus Obscuribacterales bacterium]|nr:glycosyltransferase [Candidatus Obscuribacterales bacterium]